MLRLLLVLACVSVRAHAGPQRISSGNGRNRDPRVVCTSDGTVHAVWRNNVTGVWEIHYCALRGDTSVPAPVRISTLNRNALDPVLSAGPGSTVYAAWSTGINGSYDVVFARGSAAGFGPALNISVDAPPSLEPSLAFCGGGVYAAWRNGAEGGDEVFCRSFADSAWTGIRNLSRLAGTSAAPALACAAGPSIAWNDDSYGSWNVYLRRFRDGAWQRRRAVYDGHYDGRYPALAGAGDTLHLCWLQQETASATVRYRTLSDAGWGAAVALGGPDAAGAPRMAAAAGRVCAVWAEAPDNGTPVLAARILQNGAWGPVTRFARDTVPQNPDVAAAPDGTFRCVWEGGAGGQHIYLMKLPLEE